MCAAPPLRTTHYALRTVFLIPNPQSLATGYWPPATSHWPLNFHKVSHRPARYASILDGYLSGLFHGPAKALYPFQEIGKACEKVRSQSGSWIVLSNEQILAVRFLYPKPRMGHLK